MYIISYQFDISYERNPDNYNIQISYNGTIMAYNFLRYNVYHIISI